LQDSKKTLANSLDEQKRKNRERLADWRKKNPEKAKESYRKYWREYWRRKRGPDYKPRKAGAYYGAFDKEGAE
jgi:hypothetical protein